MLTRTFIKRIKYLMNKVQKPHKTFFRNKEKEKNRIVYYLNLNGINMLKSNK